MKFLLPTLLLSSLILTASAKPEAQYGESILAQVLRAPGLYNQICDAMESKQPLPLVLASPLVSGEAELSTEAKKKLRLNRTTVIPAIKKQLLAVDFSKKPAKQKVDANSSKESDVTNGTGVDPKSLSNVLLDVIRELHAVEVLPELAAVEAKFFAALTAAQTDPKAPLPQVDGTDGAGLYVKRPEGLDDDPDKWTPEQNAAEDRRTELVGAEGLHRDTLMLMYNLMREKKFGPLLASNFEKLYLVEIQRLAAEDDVLKNAKKLEDVPEDERGSVLVDAVNGLLYRDYPPVELAFSAEAREEILHLVKEFVQKP